MIKVMLFDVDGVLVNGYSFSGRLARDYGITQEATISFFKGRFGECLVGKADLKEEIESYLPQWGWQGSVDDFLNEWFATEQSIDETLVDAILELRQQGIQCYLATNQEKYRTAYLLDQMGFGRQFDGIFSSAYVGYMKHDTAFFEHVLREIKNVKAQEMLFWDDQPGNQGFRPLGPLQLYSRTGGHPHAQKDRPTPPFVKGSGNPSSWCITEACKQDQASGLRTRIQSSSSQRWR